MMRYKHTQFGWVVVAVLLIVGAVMLITALSHSVDAETKRILFASGFILFAALLLFHSLNSTVTDTEVKVSFGVGLIKRTIPLEQIESCEVKKNQFVLGWGIRFGIGFTLWNVSGFDAVELAFKDRKWKFRIGTDDPNGLHEAIESALKGQ